MKSYYRFQRNIFCDRNEQKIISEKLFPPFKTNSLKENTTQFIIN